MVGDVFKMTLVQVPHVSVVASALQLVLISTHASVSHHSLDQTVTLSTLTMGHVRVSHVLMEPRVSTHCLEVLLVCVLEDLQGHSVSQISMNVPVYLARMVEYAPI